MIEQMSDGHYRLILVKDADRINFDRFANAFCRHYSFKILSKAKDLDVQITDIAKDEVVVAIAYDIWMNNICLESDSKDGDLLISKIAEEWDTQKYLIYPNKKGWLLNLFQL